MLAGAAPEAASETSTPAESDAVAEPASAATPATEIVGEASTTAVSDIAPEAAALAQTSPSPTDATAKTDGGTQAELAQTGGLPAKDAAHGAATVTALVPTDEADDNDSVFAQLFSRRQADASATQPEDVSEPQTIQPAISADPSDSEELATSPATTASIDDGSARVRLTVASGSGPLPGVREVRSLYEIPSRDSFDYRDYTEEAGTVQLASAAGLGVLSGGRLAVQHENVDVACLKPKLRNTLKRIEAHFGRQLVVTSGYRSRAHNRRVGGAQESRHMACEAADIKIAGVPKWQIAEYARSMPGRGGVGTYCHTDAIHVDIGPRRDWNWRCARRRK